MAVSDRAQFDLVVEPVEVVAFDDPAKRLWPLLRERGGESPAQGLLLVAVGFRETGAGNPVGGGAVVDDVDTDLQVGSDSTEEVQVVGHTVSPPSGDGEGDMGFRVSPVEPGGGEPWVE